MIQPKLIGPAGSIGAKPSRSPAKIHPDERSASETCARIKDLGFADHKHIRMYGEDFELVSDPFMDGDCPAVKVTCRSDPSVHALRLPVSILVSPRDRFRHPAKAIPQEPV